MKLRLLAAIMLLVVLPTWGLAQAKKPEILIYGSGIEAYTAAIQAAKSNLNTVWIWEEESFQARLSAIHTPINTDAGLDAGIWADLLAASRNSQHRSDSIAELAKTQFNVQLLVNAMEVSLSKYDKLTVIKNKKIKSIKKNKKNWQVTLDNHQSFQLRAIVDASADRLIATLSSDKAALEPKLNPDRNYYESQEFQVLARTGVAVSDSGHPYPYTMPLASLIPNGEQRLFVINRPADASIPLMAHIGQATGAAAAFVAFYKTTADKIEVRAVQAEILQYGQRLFPFQDIRIDDVNFVAIQKTAATGLFEPSPNAQGQYTFEPDLHVSTAELSPILNQLYSRSQIWFFDNQHEILKLSQLLSLIKYVAHKGNELEGQITKDWNRKFKFPGQYDADLLVTRRHVAVLLDEYCKPFDIKIDFKGEIQR